MVRPALLALSLLAAAAPAAGPRAPAPPADPVAEAVEDAYRRAGEAPPARDPALDAAAAALARAGEDADPRAILRAEGVADGLVLPVVLQDPSAAGVAERWGAYVRHDVVPQGLTHFGVARAPGGEGEGERVAVVLVRRLFELTRAPVAAPGARTARLEGRLARGYAGSQVLMALPDGPVETLPSAHFGRHVSVDVPLDRGDGLYRVEVVASGPRGTEVALLLDLPVGLVSARPPLPRAPAAAARDEDAESPERLAELVNRARERAGLAPLSGDPALARTARQHARAMARAGVAAHTLPGGRTPRERLAAEGVRTRRFHENVAMAATVDQAHADLWASPSHRRALLDPEVNRLGVAVEAVDTPAGRVVFVVEHLARR